MAPGLQKWDKGEVKRDPGFEECKHLYNREDVVLMGRCSR
jgi:hypothetical protein